MSANPLFLALLEHHGLPEPVTEFRFHPTRRFRFDYAWPAYAVALEVEGGAFVGGRHTRGAGFRADVEKYNEAARLGWTVARTLPEGLCSAYTVRLLCDLLTE